MSTGPLADTDRIPQDALAFAASADISMPESEERRLSNLNEYWYGPWERTQPETCSPEEFARAADSFRNQPVFGPSLLKVTAPALDAIVENARLGTYPSQSVRAIAVRNSSLRALPSSDPVFHDFRRAGEGYPFDYNQNSAVSAGTPLFLTHISADGRFVAVEAPFTCGWIDSRDIAYADDEFIVAFRSEGLAAILRDRIQIAHDGTGFLFEGRVGMLLPMEPDTKTGIRLLAPVADERRRARVVRVAAGEGNAAPVPLVFSGKQVATVINQIIGQPYGWGGLGGYRDCSSTILDVFLPFGLPLLRDSHQQVGAGRNVSIEQLGPDEKLARITAGAAPFRTILNLPGHVMLYLGTFEGVPVAFHTIWGLRTEAADGSDPGRHIIGGSVITSLSPGRELPALSRSKGDLLHRISSFTVLGERQAL